MILMRRCGATINIPIFSAVLLLLSGCVYPIHKTLQPAATVRVVDEDGGPISGATTVLITNAYPSGFEKVRVQRQTDMRGHVEFMARHEWRMEVLFLHGREVFFWHICAYKQGYKTFTSTNLSVDDFTSARTIRLSQGKSLSCSEASILKHK